MMKLPFSIIDWQASAPGLSKRDDWQKWAQHPIVVDASLPVDKCAHVPMMMARRLLMGSRLAVDCGMAILARHSVDAVIFTSRHGELERNLNILTALANQQSLSPTDFAMSVHNAAVGSLTIAAKEPLVSTSISAGIDSFQQGLFEECALRAAGYKNILLVDFDGAIPLFYHPHLPEHTPNFPYSVALLLGDSTDGSKNYCCQSSVKQHDSVVQLPQSLMFLHALLANKSIYSIPGEQHDWLWESAHV